MQSIRNITYGNSKARRRNLILFYLVIFMYLNIFAKISVTNNKASTFSIKQGKYFGQAFPEEKPLPFGRGILSTDKYWPHSSPIFSPDGKEVYFSVYYPDEIDKPKDILFMENKNGKWTKPQMASFSSDYSDDCPIFSFDYQRIYFSSNRPSRSSSKGKYDIWYVQRQGSTWSEPNNLGKHIKTAAKNLYSPVMTRSGNIYFSGNDSLFRQNHDIFVSKYKEGSFKPAVKLSQAINSPLHESWFYVDPGEHYMIFFSGAQGIGSDLCISFNNGDGEWSDRKSMGDIITSRGIRMPMISPDNRFLFFQGGEGCWWVDAKIIDYLKNNDLDFFSQLIRTINEQGIIAGTKQFHYLRSKHHKYFDLNERSINKKGYQFVHYKKYTEAIAIFRLNEALYPDSYNVYDSLGEAYMKIKSYDLAIEFYEKSLYLNPENENAKIMLKKLKNSDK